MYMCTTNQRRYKKNMKEIRFVNSIKGENLKGNYVKIYIYICMLVEMTHNCTSFLNFLLVTTNLLIAQVKCCLILESLIRC